MDLHEALYTTRAMRRVGPEPIPYDVQARILDAAIRAPSGGNQQNWRFLWVDDPAKKAALAPLYQHAMGELWTTVYKDQLEAAHADPEAPESVQMFKVQRSAQWLADNFETVPLFLFPFCQYDPTGGSIYPAVWSAMLAARAEGIGTCLTALLQFFHPTETFEILEVPTGEGWILSGTVSFGYPTGTWGLAPRRPAHEVSFRNTWDTDVGFEVPAPLWGGLTELTVPFAGTVLRVSAGPGDQVGAGAVLVVLESMKMEHVVEAPAAGTVRAVAVSEGDAVQAGDVLVLLDEDEAATKAPRDEGGAAAQGAADGSAVRPELADLRHRVAATLDDGRPAATERRHARGRRTARENIEDLCEPDSFEEYGALVIAAQRARRSTEDLVANTPADGLVAGIGRVNGNLFDHERSRCAVLSYDYSVLAGTQGQMNHRKKDRLFELVERLHLPVVLFAEGGGGRPGDTDMAVVTGLDTEAFARFGALSGKVPLVGVVSGRCFAGNAALLGCCHVIIATPDANIGMGGPAMIEGGGLGVYHPEEIGPVSVQVPNGVVDVLCADEKEAVAVARRYLAYFQGDVQEWTAPDQDRLRDVVPPDRRRVYDVRRAIDLLADEGSVLELRPSFAPGLVTALARMEGRAIGVIANNPLHLAGAIDAADADKAARFLQLCEAFGLPVLSLCDTPGFMVGPEAEATALVRHVSRMFVVGASLTVPFACVITRKAYGLGAQAMAGGSFRRPLFTVAWPTGELGGMGLEGAVRLGFRRELDGIDDPEERAAAFDAMVARAYEHGKAVHVAEHFEIDDVIDPALTRRRFVHALDAAGRSGPAAGAGASGGRRPFVDTW